MKRKFLAALLALVMVFSMIPVSASAADDNVIYAGEDNGINITLNHRAGAVGSTEVSFTVIVDDKTVVDSKNYTSTTTLAYINISANNYDVDIETEGMSCTAGLNGNYNLGFGISNTHSCTIKLTTAKTKDDIPIQSKETTYGTFSWSKQHAGNCDFERTVEIYVNDEFAYSQTVKTPNQLSNIMGVNKQFWFTPAEGYKAAYSMNREVLDTAALKDLRIDLITVCGCGLDTCVCDGGCSCPEDCDCEACTGATLKPNQIQTDYGLLEYSEATGRGYNLTVVINVNGEVKYTSPQLRISCGLPGNLKFTPTEGEYYLQDPNSYDLDTLRSGSTWIPGTGQLSIVGITDEVRNYDNKLTIYLVSFENNVSLDVERRVTIDDSISGYRISYTMDGVDYSFDWYNFNASQTPSIPTNVPVTVTAICDSPYEVAQWSTGNVYGGNVTLEGSEGQNNTEAYGNTVTLTVNSVGDPRILLYMDKLSTVTVPSEDDLIDNPEQGENDVNIIGANAVKIHCANEKATHDKDATYGLEKETFTIGTLEGNSADGYTCKITISEPSTYVDKYNTLYTGHELVDGQGTKSFTLKWVNGKWTVPTNEIPVTYNVACTTEPGGGGEDKPEAPNLSGVTIQVVCTNNEHSGNAQATYDLIDGSYNESMSKIDDVYTYTVTVSADKYVSRFSTDSRTLHKLDLDYSYSDTLTIVYTYDGESWQTSGKGNTFFVTCAESGEEQPTPPSITPEEVIALMGDNAIEVACKTEGSGHNPSSYSLIPESFEIGSVTPDENGQYSCEITIDEDGILQYVDAYSQTVDYEHRTGIYRGPITFTITHDGTKWLQPKVPVETITVVCEADQEDELDEGDLNEILGGAITVQCVSEEEHEYKILTADNLLENAYSVTKNADGTYTVTLDGEKYASAYGTYVSGEIGENENIAHQLVNAEDASFAITLTHDGIKWTYSPSPIVIEVTCKDDSGDEPDEPTPDPNPTPDPTPTPDPGDDDNPPYIPPVDPDDSGVSELLNTDDHIQYLFGYPEGTFGPENNMTRAEVAQMFYNLLLDQDVTITKTFDDVPANAWYAKAVNTLASLGVVSGVGNGDFEPERSITRAEFTSIAMKFAEGKTGGTNIFSDVKSTDWFYRAVVNSTQYGWIHGYGDGTFRPNNPITRVEVTAIVNNMLGREADVDFVTEHYDELNHFSDLAVSHWGYYHIVEATNDHDYTKPSSGENWTELN